MLNPRLTAVAAFIPAGASFADIGTDHAALPIAMVKARRCPFAVASDFNRGPYLAARENVRQAGLAEKITVLQGSGLTTLQPGQVDIAVFAGMGGLLIDELLAAAPAVVDKLQGLILQPQLAVDKVRLSLYRSGWHIAGESLAKDGGHLYQIIYALPGRQPVPAALTLQLGPCLLAQRPALWPEHLAILLRRYRAILAGLKKAKHFDGAAYGAAQQTLAALEKLR